MKTRLKILLSGILAGFSISLGGIVYLSSESKVLGAMFFTVGLFCVCSFGFHLYTGKICYVFDNDKNYALNIPFIWLGNLIGCWVTAQLILQTRVVPALVEKAQALCEVKLSDNLLSILILAFFCNIFIYIGVEGYARIPYEVGKYLALFFGVMVFILCGYEHCVANMFYFSVAGAWSGKTLLYLLVMTFGNFCGGVALPLLRRAIK